MAASGYTPILIYSSATTTNVPLAANLSQGELAINTADGKLFYKDSGGTVQVIATKAGALGTVTSVSGTGTVNGLTLTGTVTTSGSLTLGGTLDLSSPPAIGGTAAAAGSFTALSYTTTLTGGTGVVNLGSGQFYKDASGNVGIGTSSPSQKLSVVSGNNLRQAQLGNVSNYPAFLCRDSDGTTATSGFWDATQQIFTNAGAERMRIDSSGNLLVGTTSVIGTGKLQVNTGNTTQGISAVNGPVSGNFESSDSTHAGYWSFGRDNVSTGNFVFYSNGASKGYISASTGAYTAVSDARLKKDIIDLTYGLDAVMQLRPVSYLMNEENDTAKKHIGLIAQEVKSVIDEAVDDAEKNSMYGLDKCYSRT